MGERTRIGRRTFLRWSALGALAPWLGAGAAGPGAAAEAPRVQRYVRLGRTGLEISDVSFGSSRLRGDERLVHHALERGVNYFDTAESYTGGRSEETLGRALAGRREKVILCSKTHCGADTGVDELMAALEGSLRRLRTDRIDVYLNHAVNDPARVRNPAWPEFVERARAQGKIRFSGVSGHGGRLAACLEHVLEQDQADVILVAHHFGQDPSFLSRLTAPLDFVALQPELPRLLAAAKQRDVGVVAMKTLMGARLNDMRPYEAGGATFAQAAFRWVLSQPDVDALIVTMKTPEAVDEYLGASGWRTPDETDVSLLERYFERHAGGQCRFGCEACHASCPHGVPVADVLRSRMYAADYGDAELGRESYATLGAGASACLGCDGTPCATACPHGLAISRLTRRAHLELAGGPAQPVA